MKIKMVDVIFAEWESPSGDLFVFSAMSKKHRWYVSSVYPLFQIKRIAPKDFIQLRWLEMRALRDKLEMELHGNSDK